jgi:hypothetical protein
MVGYDPLTGSLPERYDVQALLGHEDYATAQRYAHLAPDAHDKVIESWGRRSRIGAAMMAHVFPSRGARLAHGCKKSRFPGTGNRRSDLGRGGRI